MSDPSIRLVSNRSDAQIEYSRCKDEAFSDVVQLAANLMRIAGGGGKEHELYDQVYSTLKSLTAYHLAGRQVGQYDYVANAMWNWKRDRFADGGSPEDRERRWENGENDRAAAVDRICNGALRIVASRLLGQRTQQSAAERELYEGLRMMEQAKEKSDRYYARKPIRPPKVTRKRPIP